MIDPNTLPKSVGEKVTLPRFDDATRRELERREFFIEEDTT
jgi:hypothetical protein